jgi:hypothetical protein
VTILDQINLLMLRLQHKEQWLVPLVIPLHPAILGVLELAEAIGLVSIYTQVLYPPKCSRED